MGENQRPREYPLLHCILPLRQTEPPPTLGIDRGSRSHPPPPRPQATSPMPSGGLHAVYERRAGRRRTSGWCTWSRDFSESWSVEAGRQPARRRRPAPPHGQFSQVHLPHLPAHEGKRSTQDEAALRGGRGASSDSPHQSSPTSHPPHPASMRSRASSDLIAGKAARRRRQRGRSGRRLRSRGEADAHVQRIIINSENRAPTLPRRPVNWCEGVSRSWAGGCRSRAVECPGRSLFCGASAYALSPAEPRC